MALNRIRVGTGAGFMSFSNKVISDGLGKNRKTPFFVIPVKAGIQYLAGSRLSLGRRLDTGIRRYDGLKFFFMRASFVNKAIR